MDGDEDWPGAEEVEEFGSDTDKPSEEVEEIGSDKDKPSSKDGPSRSLTNALEKIVQSFTSPSKQLTLAKTLEKQGTPSEIIRRSSPGASKRPSLEQLLSAEVKDHEAKAKEDAKKVSLEGVEGESLPAEEIKQWIEG